MTLFFKFLSLITIFTIFDQLYLYYQYNGIAKETIFLTLLILILNIYFGFFHETKSIDIKNI